ncbi:MULTISPECIES: LysR substrate-binding domain-containing protein [Cupriavidus]|uniref:Regulatory protein, LysR:LysR, substrate-binding protein n=1 Tax=Cupriavidus pinatubonensis (strain JMP 134 / LMG 1197) TaxID=264198 RepID=Q471Q9_CUPPJ|nr:MULTISPECIES: LysR substrate-binding domain-containing protein [Cupriavidus]QYY33063.1 LysR family transcriptional regulator [Cupriavidus pinatubonensis]TPQ39156.1 LysR family transcriptional regulator [Cupriavidus pinatubonensis]
MPVPFDITDFRLFVNVAETRSLTRGAERSFLSVPAVSNRIKNLEDTLGLRLLERSPQGVTLTAAGEVYLQHARVVLTELERLTGNLQPFTTGLSGQLKLVANTTAITEYLPPVIGDYLATHPDVRIEVRERLSDDIVRLVREGGTDLGIISGNIPTQGLQSVPFVKSSLIVVAPLGHPLLAERDVWFGQVLDHAFVALLEGSAFQMFMTRAAGSLHKPMTIRVHVASYDAICRMVAAGAGIAIMPKAAFVRLKGQQQIGACNLRDDWAVRTFQVCARDLDGLSSFAREFANLLIGHYAPGAEGS